MNNNLANITIGIVVNLNIDRVDLLEKQLLEHNDLICPLHNALFLCEWAE